jgi:outer membrane murein-binding lipoprotein Lpp
MAVMNRRDFAVAAMTSSVLAVAGCDNDQKPARTSTLLNNSGVQEAMKAVEDAIGGLESNVDNFDDENWREVVPEVKTSATDVRDAFDRLRQELGVADSQ